MKKSLIFLILLSNLGFAQGISHHALSSQGGYVSGLGLSVSYTIGQQFIPTLNSANYILTEGFQQATNYACAKAGTISGTELCSGNSGTTLTLVNSLGSIRWQRSANWASTTPTWNAVSGTAPTLATGALTTSMAYRAILTGGLCKDTTAVFVVTVSPKPLAGIIALVNGSKQLLCSGSSSKLAVSGSLGGLQWQKATTSAGPWSNIYGATDDTLSLENLSATALYRVRVTSGVCAPVTSSSTAITVKQPTNAGTLTASSTSLCSGSGATLTLTGQSGTVSWQKSTNWNGTSPTWGSATGTTPTLTLTGLTTSTAYRAVLRNAPCASSMTQQIVISVSPKAIAGTAAFNNATNGIVCNGGSRDLKLTGSSGAIQWQSSNSSATSGFSDVSQATTSTLSLSAISNNAWYRAKVSSGACPTVYSNVLAISVKQPTVAGTISGTPTTVCSGTGKTLSLTGSSGTIAWQKSINWEATTPTWTSVTGTTATLASGSLTASTAFRAVLSNAPCPSATTNIFVIMVDPKVVTKTITANTTAPTGSTLAAAICPSTSKTLTLGTGYVGNIQWQQGTTATGPWTNIDGANTASYTVSNPTLGANFFRVNLTSGVCTTAATTAFAVYYKTCTSTLVSVDDDQTIPQEAENIQHLVEKENIPETTLNNAVSNEFPLFNALAIPNPFGESFYIQLKTNQEEPVHLRLVDVSGKLICEKEVVIQELERVHLGEGLSNGVYQVLITQANEAKILRVVKY
jgi:hypothetical protein